MNDIVNTSSKSKEKMSDSKVVKEILRSLVERFQSKVTSIEENKDIQLKLDKLVRNLQIYEANHRKEKKSKGLALNTKIESIDIEADSEIDHEIVTNFVKCYIKHF